MTRNLADVYELRVQAEAGELTESINDHVADLLSRDVVRYTELGASLLGRRVAATFPSESVVAMVALLSGETVRKETLVHDAGSGRSGLDLRDTDILRRLSGFRRGLDDA